MNAIAISLLFLVIFKINCINLLFFDVHSCHATRMNQETRQGHSLGALSLLFFGACKEITKKKNICKPVRLWLAAAVTDSLCVHHFLLIEEGLAPPV